MGDSSDDFLDGITIPSEEIQKVEDKIKRICQPLNVSKLNEIKKEFNALKLVLNIKKIIQHQSKVEKSIPVLRNILKYNPNKGNK